MRRVEAMDILRGLARDGADANAFSRISLADTIRRDWPDSFTDTLSAPQDLVGYRSPVSPRDVHIKGLLRAIEERPGLERAVGTAKLRYHSRWLLYLGEPTREPPPRVSIIIPIYNRAWLVDSLIQNCLGQSYSQIEIVVVDDGSTDETAARLATFGDRIKLIRQPNGGVSAARNAAVLAATGELLHFLDSDNLLVGEHVEAKVRAFASIPDADLCYCSVTDVSLFGVKPPLSRFYTVREDYTSPMVDLLDSIVTDGFLVPVSSMTMPRHIFLENGLFDTDLQRAEDSRYWFRLALTGVKAIGLTRRLVYRCRMPDGLHERRHLDGDIASSVVCVRNVADLLRRPEQWPAAAAYLSRNPAKERWDRLLDSEGGAYGRDFEILLRTIADLPSAGRSSNRSPLPLLVFLWTLAERHQTLEGTARFKRAVLRDLLKESLIVAMVDAEPLGQADRDNWVCRGPKLRAKQEFKELPWTAANAKLSSQIGPKLAQTVAFLQSIAGFVGDRDVVVGIGRAPQEKTPTATVVVPVLATPSAAQATLASCLAQTVTDRIEILVIEQNKLRAAFWAKRYPQVRVIVSPMVGSLVEAHAAGLVAAQSARIRFLFPGDILDSHSLARQIETSKSFRNKVAVIEVKDGSSNQPSVSVRHLEASFFERRPPVTLSTMLLPRSLFRRVGAFDLPLGDAYQARYMFRLLAASVSGVFVKAKSASVYVKPPTGRADQLALAALANLIQCLGDRRLWRHIPAIVRSLGVNAAEDRGLHCLNKRVLNFAFNVIGSLSTASRSGLAAFALCLVGLEWGRPMRNLSRTAPQLAALHSAIFNVASDLSLDTLGKLSLTEALAEVGDDPSFAQAAKRALDRVPKGAGYAGLRDALRRLLKKGKSAREPSLSHGQTWECIVQCDRENAWLYHGIGKLLQRWGRLDKAEAAYRRAIELEPSLGEAHRQLRILFAQQGRYEEALAAARSVVECNPEDAKLCYELGKLLQRQERLDEAEAAYRRAIELEPSLGEAHRQLRVILAEQKRQDTMHLSVTEKIGSFARWLTKYIPGAQFLRARKRRRLASSASSISAKATRSSPEESD